MENVSMVSTAILVSVTLDGLANIVTRTLMTVLKMTARIMQLVWMELLHTLAHANQDGLGSFVKKILMNV